MWLLMLFLLALPVFLGLLLLLLLVLWLRLLWAILQSFWRLFAKL